MGPKAESLDHRRTHNLLLISRLLSLRDNPSPFTLLLDSLRQSAKPLVREYLARAASSKLHTVFVSFVSFRPPSPSAHVSVHITARRKTPAQLQAEIAAAIPRGTRTLLILDTLNPLSAAAPSQLAPFLSALLAPSVSVLATYHVDVPLPPPPPPPPSDAQQNAYPENAPEPLTLLRYFATTIVQVHSIAHVLAAKEARDRARPPPAWGLDEGVEGVLVGLGSNAPEGVVLELEYRRKSGRGVAEWYYLPLDGDEPQPPPPPPGGEKRSVGGGPREKEKEKIILLEDHPSWRLSEVVQRQGMDGDGEAEEGEEDGMPRSTFSLGLTERQKAARDEVVLPYFDAQREGGIGGGGAILFTPDKDIDDFDDEEDEI